MTHATNKDDGGTDPIHALAAMEERLKAVEEYLGIIVGSANFTAGMSDKIAESVVQDLQQACYDRDELRATVERLTAELDTTKRLLAESLVERDRLKNLHDARKVRIDGFRDVLREKLGDLV